MGAMPPRELSESRNSQKPELQEKSQTLDWIAHPDRVTLTAFQTSLLNLDWLSSSLGPIAAWPTQLSQMILTVVAEPTPACVTWGCDLAVIYNEAFSRLLRVEHTVTQGQPLHLAAPNVWPQLEQPLRNQSRTGEAAFLTSRHVLLPGEDGELQDSYLTWKIVPILGSTGAVAGAFTTVLNVSRETILGRRSSVQQKLRQEASTSNSLDDLWSRVLGGLQDAEDDIPLAFIYSPSMDGSTFQKSSSPSQVDTTSRATNDSIFDLRGTIRVPNGHRLTPPQLNVSQDVSWLASAFRQAASSLQPVLLSTKNMTIAGTILDDIPWRNSKPTLSRLVVFPIYHPSSNNVLAFLVVALNPLRKYDGDYQDFFCSITQQTTLARLAILGINTANQKNTLAADQEAAEQALLALALSTRTIELTESETRFSRFATRANVALGILAADGSVIYTNPLWKQLTQLEVGDDQIAWAKAIIPEDLEPTYEIFARMAASRLPTSFQLRFNYPWKIPDLGPDGLPKYTDTSILCNLYPDLDENGDIVSIMSCLTDISELKWTESQLLRRQADVEARELMWRDFTDKAPIGLCLMSADGSLDFGNDTWWAMTKSPRSEVSGLSWIERAVLPEDAPKVRRMFQDTLRTQEPATLEFRLNSFWEDVDSTQLTDSPKARNTILATVHMTLNEDKSVKHLVGWLTDISAQKAAEDVLRRRMDEAIRIKQQQERFIDMTSHEMRNPLSAMLHCADAILTSMDTYLGDAESEKNGFMSNDTSKSIRDAPQEHFKDIVEAADSIIYCAMHQKRIVDDILTLSRLDSNLLVIVPEPVNPMHVVRNALKMFEVEIKKADIDFQIFEHPSFKELGIDWTLMDASRVLQVLINLMTNAIKFTRSEQKRKIEVTVAATLIPSSDHVDKELGFLSDVKYVTKNKSYQDFTTGPEWGDGQIIYLVLSVKDTGRGLDDDEQKVLFNLFQQASPKTHVQYGGSGLGLFISRQLVEMQGGRIGVASAPGKGSNFTFFVKTRKTRPPEQANLLFDTTSTLSDTAVSEACDSNGSSLRQNTPISQENMARPIPQSNNANIHILVVEDNLVNQKVVVKQLRKLGCTVYTANQGIEAIDFLRTSEHWQGNLVGKGAHRLSVVLLDVEMPVMDGITCIRRIRDLERLGSITGHIPVLATTANARMDQIVAAIDAGMDNVITKPYRIPYLLKQIRELVTAYDMDRKRS